MLPTTNLRTDLILIKDQETGKIRKIPITKEQYMGILKKKETSSRTEGLIILDVDTHEKLFHGEYGDIKGFEDLKFKDTSNLKWICDYGNSHLMEEKCTCIKTFKVFPCTFRIRAHELFGIKTAETETLDSGRVRVRYWYSAVYVQDLKPDQKMKIINFIK